VADAGRFHPVLGGISGKLRVVNCLAVGLLRRENALVPPPHPS